MDNKNNDFNPKILQMKTRFIELRKGSRRRWVPKNLKNSVVELLRSGIPRAILAKEFSISYAQMRDWDQAFVKKSITDTTTERRTLTVVPTPKPTFHFSLDWVWRGMSIRFLFGETQEFAHQ